MKEEERGFRGRASPDCRDKCALGQHQKEKEMEKRKRKSLFFFIRTQKRGQAYQNYTTDL